MRSNLHLKVSQGVSCPRYLSDHVKMTAKTDHSPQKPLPQKYPRSCKSCPNVALNDARMNLESFFSNRSSNRQSQRYPQISYSFGPSYTPESTPSLRLDSTFHLSDITFQVADITSGYHSPNMGHPPTLSIIANPDIDQDIDKDIAKVIKMTKVVTLRHL